MQIRGGEVAVHVGAGPQCTALYANWSDDARIDKIIYELNFGGCAGERSV